MAIPHLIACISFLVYFHRFYYLGWLVPIYKKEKKKRDNYLKTQPLWFGGHTCCIYFKTYTTAALADFLFIYLFILFYFIYFFGECQNNAEIYNNSQWSGKFILREKTSTKEEMKSWKYYLIHSLHDCFLLFWIVFTSGMVIFIFNLLTICILLELT